MTDWVNLINEDGYVPIHLATTKGMLVMYKKNAIKALIFAGASTDIRTPMGLDVLHLAAQGDFPEIIAYFSESGLDLETTDSRGLTPLHWASYMGAYYAASVLCSLRVSRNAKDSEGHTPLHLAVVGNNQRVLKLLIIKGGLKDALDNKGRTPMDLAILNKFTNLQSSLKNSTLMEILGFKPNLSPFASSLWPFVILIFSLICCFVIIGIFCATCKAYIDNRIGSYVFGGTSCSVVFLMIFISNSNPGYLEKNPKGRLTVRYILGIV
jgi:palmitoyltransferase ZDHHC13/17